MTNIVPGPGQYNPDPRARLPATTFKYSIAGRPTSASREAVAPGPGAYDVKAPREKAGTMFGKDSRKPLSQSFSQLVPGPGAYDSASSTAKRYAAPKYTYIFCPTQPQIRT